MKLKVGIVGLLIVLIVVLVMTRPRSDPSREGFTVEEDVGMTMLYALLGTVAFFAVMLTIQYATGVQI